MGARIIMACTVQFIAKYFMHAYRQDFIRFAVAQNVLRFGEFQTKAGRLSPYFFNSGLFQDGAALRELCQFYAQAISPPKCNSICCSAPPTRAFRW